jgi:acetyl esterase/lipase
MKRDYTIVHAQLRQALKMTPSLSFNNRNLRMFRLLTSITPVRKRSEEVTIENIFIDREDGETKIRLRLYKVRSASRPGAVLLWFHGGGYIMGKPEMDDSICLHYAAEAGITVVSADYRLAPEHPFPSGLNDAFTALKWINHNAEVLGIDPSRIAVGGKSAGGGLAAALAQLALSRYEISPVFQLLVYPMLDDRTVLRADIDDSNSPVWSRKSNRFGWESYLSKECGSDTVPEYSVPARCKDLRGLPDAWIGLGTLDVFYEEDAAYAQRLKDHGVECEAYIVPGAFHGFDVLVPEAPVVKAFRASQIAALRKYLS